MKIKYRCSMVAGLIVMTTASCKEDATTEKDADKPAPEKTAEATTKAAPAEAEKPAVVAPSAYYIMFKGDGG